MSIFVVAIHVRPLYGCTNTFVLAIYDNISCAVPFFFLASGFLLYKNSDADKIMTLKKYLKKLYDYICYGQPFSKRQSYASRLN